MRQAISPVVIALGSVATGQNRALFLLAEKAKDMGSRMGSVAWRWIDDDIADLRAENTLHDARPHLPDRDDAQWIGEPTERVQVDM